MKKLFVTLLMLLPVSAIAQDMIAEMQEMSVCMASIDQNALKALEKETVKFEGEMKGLCKKGKRDEAQERAVDFSREMMRSSTLKTMLKCTEKMSVSMRKMMPDMEPEKMAKDYSNRHVCDEI